MTAIPRKSPKLAPGYSKDDVRDAIDALEDRPYIPRKTPLSGDDGYEGQICRDDSRGYLYTGGRWTYWTLTVL